MKRAILISVVVLLCATQVFPKLFVLIGRPKFIDNGVVCELEVEAGNFEYDFPITDPMGNWTLVDMNGVRTVNQMRAEIVSGPFIILETVNYEPNSLDLHGHVKITGPNLLPGNYEFQLRVLDIEDNNSLNTYQLIARDRTPPAGGCWQ